MPVETMARETVHQAAEQIMEHAEPIVQQVVEKAEPVVQKVVESAEPMVQKVVEHVQPIMEKIVEHAEPVIQKVVENVTKIIDPVVEAVVNNVPESMSNAPTWREFVDRMRDTTHLTLDQIEARYPDVHAFYPTMQRKSVEVQQYFAEVGSGIAAGSQELLGNASDNLTAMTASIQLIFAAWYVVMADLFASFGSHISTLYASILASLSAFGNWCIISSVIFGQDLIRRSEQHPIPVITGIVVFFAFLMYLLVSWYFLPKEKKVSNSFKPRPSVTNKTNTEMEGLDYRLFKPAACPSPLVKSDETPEDAADDDVPAEDDDDKMSVVSVASSAVSALSSASRRISKGISKNVRKSFVSAMGEIPEDDEIDFDELEAERHSPEADRETRRRRPVMPVWADGVGPHSEPPLRRSRRIAARSQEPSEDEAY